MCLSTVLVDPFRRVARFWRALRRVHRALRWMGFLAVLGAAYQALSTARDREEYPPLGRMVAVNGHRMHLYCRGEAGPTVVLEAGYGDYSLTWLPILQDVARVARVCAYDRAGYGWSEVSPRIRTLADISEELHDLLCSAGLTPPYILVGHALGGVYAQYFARRYPSEVAGMVLVDGTPPELYRHIRASVRQRARLQIGRRWLEAMFGLLRLRVRMGLARLPVADELPREAQQTVAALNLSTSYYGTMADEAVHLSPNLQEQVEAAGPFPDIPLIVLTPPTAEWVKVAGDAGPDIWTEGQKRLAQLSPQGRLVYVPDCGHAVHHGKPQAVVEAIQTVVEAVRRATSPLALSS